MWDRNKQCHDSYGYDNHNDNQYARPYRRGDRGSQPSHYSNRREPYRSYENKYGHTNRYGYQSQYGYSRDYRQRDYESRRVPNEYESKMEDDYFHETFTGRIASFFARRQQNNFKNKPVVQCNTVAYDDCLPLEDGYVLLLEVNHEKT